MTNSQEGRHNASFEVRGRRVGLELSSDIVAEIERLALEDQDKTMETIVSLVDQTAIEAYQQMGTVNWERELKAITVRAATNSTRMHLISACFMCGPEGASIGISLVRYGKHFQASIESQSSDDDNNDPPSGPRGGRRKGKAFAEELADELQALAEEREREPCAVAGHQVMHREIQMFDTPASSDKASTSNDELRTALFPSSWENGEAFLAAEFASPHKTLRRSRLHLLEWVVSVLSAIVSHMMSAAMAPAFWYEGATSRWARLNAVRNRLALLHVEVDFCLAANTSGAAGKLWGHILPVYVEIAVLARDNGEHDGGLANHKEAASVSTLLAQIEVILRRNTAGCADGQLLASGLKVDFGSPGGYVDGNWLAFAITWPQHDDRSHRAGERGNNFTIIEGLDMLDDGDLREHPVVMIHGNSIKGQGGGMPNGHVMQ